MEALQEEWVKAKDGFNHGVSFVDWLCRQVIALRHAAQQSGQPTYGTLPASEVYTTPEDLPAPVVRLEHPISG